MARKYKLPEKTNDKLLETLGEEIEMKTFKTNVSLVDEPRDSSPCKRVVGIFCVGDYIGYSCGARKSLFVDDYIQVRPPVKLKPDSRPLIGVDLRLKKIRWQRSEEHEPTTVMLQFWELMEVARCRKYARGLADTWLKNFAMGC